MTRNDLGLQKICTFLFRISQQIKIIQEIIYNIIFIIQLENLSPYLFETAGFRCFFMFSYWFKYKIHHRLSVSHLNVFHNLDIQREDLFIRRTFQESRILFGTCRVSKHKESGYYEQEQNDLLGTGLQD